MNRVDKPWGYELIFAKTGYYVGKVLFVKAGNRLSLQYHREKMESMYFVEGQGVITLGEGNRATDFIIGKGASITIHPGDRHRIRAVTDVLIFEVSTPQLEDVVRLEDDYGRVET